MATFRITLADDRSEEIEGADAYQQEGPLTTFFAMGGQRQVIDSWSVRLASFRTSDIVSVRRTGVGAELRAVGADDEVGVPAPTLLKSA